MFNQKLTSGQIKLVWLLCCAILINGVGYAQNVAINADGSLPDRNAILDIKSNSKGLLLPRMTTESRLKIPNTQGLIVYDINTNSFWYNTGKQWQNMAPDLAALAIADSAWLLTGNAGTVDGVHFLGTIDSVAFNIRVNNQRSGRIDPTRNNAFWGYKSGVSIISGPSFVFAGSNNTAMGSNSLFSTITGSQNTAIGSSALLKNTFGDGNTACGAASLFSNIHGNFNSAFGYNALSSNTTGASNTAVGMSAMSSNINGYMNTAVGASSLAANTGGFYNTAIGHFSLWQNSTGIENTAGGLSCMQSNRTGKQNTAFGTQALASITGGSQNTAIGFQAMFNSTVSGNTAVGYQSMYWNLNGIRNTAVGNSSLFSNTTGSDNTAIGDYALNQNTTGLQNVGVGLRALEKNTTGSSNSAQGTDALRTNTVGRMNTANGSGSMYLNETGDLNTATGVNALFQNRTGSLNTALGTWAMLSNQSGSDNVGIGFESLSGNISGLGNTAVGARADVLAPNLTNATAIGYTAVVNASNKVRIGNAFVTVIEGQVPFTTPSDGRFKFGVQEDVKGLDFIMQLRPVTYLFDVKRFEVQMGGQLSDNAAYDEAMNMRRSGFIAQEVEKAAVNTDYNFSGIIKPKNEKEHYSLSYDAFVVPLVKAVQEQQLIIDKQNKRINELEERLRRLEQFINKE